MTLQRDIQLAYDQVDSPIGKLVLVVEGEALVSLDFEGYEARLVALLEKRYGAGVFTERCVKSRDPGGFADALAAYFAGELKALERIPVKTGGTAFEQSCWLALRGIAPGSTATYGAQAAQLNRPRAVRAVGRTNGLNPIAIVLPCHRVIGANGKLTGYAGGLARKEWLLAHEAKYA